MESLNEEDKGDDDDADFEDVANPEPTIHNVELMLNEDKMIKTKICVLKTSRTG
ncbi:hypothetical protein TGAMA5MH_07708 [Trichoderma gamsii]|uniref:Uncharacterized protein n=1 Tax=Trichoderma gamsii TaxID=398673 RepID=A0A2K0T4C6_9HYPO|nr:hypothetical protein TGAMA5MH_07708 [Trichoderma gamsii]